MGVTAKVIAVTIVMVPVLYIGACSAISFDRNRGFALVKEGDTEQQVIAAMGEPADREMPSNRLAKYGSPECRDPCVQRLWYPNYLGLVGEAWSVELDASGHVVHTAHIVSP